MVILSLLGHRCQGLKVYICVFIILVLVGRNVVTWEALPTIGPATVYVTLVMTVMVNFDSRRNENRVKCFKLSTF